MPIIHVVDERNRNRYNKLLTKVPSIVLFYADWCGHCKALKPEWNHFERAIKDSKLEDDLMIASVSEQEIGNVDGDKDILGFPTIFYLMNGEKQEEFKGPRNVDGLIEFLESVRPETRGKLQRRIKDKEPSVKLLQMGGRRKKRTIKRRTIRRKTSKRSSLKHKKTNKRGYKKSKRKKNKKSKI